MSDELLRQAERDWRADPWDHAACERFLRECARAGADPPLELHEKRVFPARRLDLPPEVRSAWVEPWPRRGDGVLFGLPWYERPWAKEVPRPPGPFEVGPHRRVGVELVPPDLAALSDTLRAVLDTCAGADLVLRLDLRAVGPGPMPDVGPAELARFSITLDPEADECDPGAVLAGMRQVVVGRLAVRWLDAPRPACVWAIDLGEVSNDPGSLERLAASSPRLRSLSASVWDRPLAELRRLRALERLELGFRWRRLEEEDGLALSGLPALRELRLGSPTIAPGFLAALSEGDGRLERLLLEGNTELANTKVLREVGRLTSLREIVASVPAVAFKGWERLERLEHLDLCVEGPLDHVAIAFVPSLPLLRWLRIDFSEVSDLVAEQVAASRSLEHVLLDHSNALTDRGLLALRKMPRLRSLSVVDTATTQEGRDAFRAARPDVRVEP